MRLGKNQVLALGYLARRGEHAPGGAGNRPWQLNDSQYQRVLDSLVAKGLAARSETGVMRIDLRVGAVARFAPHYNLTGPGHRALEEVTNTPKGAP